MLIVHVFVHVKAGMEEDFLRATLVNAENSVQEPGIARFDVIRDIENPDRFVLVEVYRTAEDPARHKQTAHYKKWRETVEEMMAEPRRSIKYHNLYPDDERW